MSVSNTYGSARFEQESVGRVVYASGAFYLIADVEGAEAWATWTSVDGAEWSRVG